MLTADDATLRARAERLAAAASARSSRATAKVGGGALPLLELPGPGRRGRTARRRSSPPACGPTIRRWSGRIQDGRLLLDPRTLADDEIDLVRAALG